MSEREQDIFQIMGKNIEPATKIVGAGASEVKNATGWVFGMIARRETSRLLHKFYNWHVTKRMRK